MPIRSITVAAVAARLERFLAQPASWHPEAHKGKFHLQLVDSVRRLQIGVWHRARIVTDAASADPRTFD